MANKQLKKLKIGTNGETYDICDSAARQSISTLSTKVENIAPVSMRVIQEAQAVSTTGTSAYWDPIDQAWVYYSRRTFSDESRSSNYYVLVKEKRDGTRKYTAKAVFDGTTYPVKSGSLSVTGIQRWNNYYLVSVRSNEANIPSDGVENSSIWGYLLVFDVDTLEVVASQSFNAKCSNVNIVSSKFMIGDSSAFMIVSCQMSYFQIFKITAGTDGAAPTLSARSKTYFKAFAEAGSSVTDIHSDIQEFQGGQFYYAADKKLFISAGFGDGIHIVDVTSIGSTGKYTAIYNYNWADHRDVVGQNYNVEGVHQNSCGSTFNVAIDYPYVYCSFAQPTAVITHYNETGDDQRVQGMLVLDITDLEDIKGKLYTIPKADCQSDTSGDPKPCTIVKAYDKVILGMGNKGIATFKVDGMNVAYEGITSLPHNPVIRYMALNEHGELFCRNTNPEPIYQKNGNGFFPETVNRAFYSTIVDTYTIPCPNEIEYPEEEEEEETTPTLTSISAVYNGTTPVALSSVSEEYLKSNITVTALYSDSSTSTVTDYTIAGELNDAGTSETLTITYSGKTCTLVINITNDTPTELSSTTSADNELSIEGLDSNDYELCYEDENGNKLEGWMPIGSTEEVTE